MTKTWRPYLLIFILIVLLYGQTAFFNFSRLDDNVILEKAEILGNFKNLGQIFSSDVFLSDHRLYYRPLLNCSYLIDAIVGGQSPVIYHLFNIFWHFLAVSLLYCFLKKILQRPPLALFLSLLFLVHPILTQAVAWIPGRNDSLLAVWVLAAVLSFINFCSRPTAASLGGYFIFFLLAVLTKETAIFLPLLLVVYYYTLGREQKLKRRDQAKIILASLVVYCFWLLLRQLALGGGDNTVFALFRNLPQGLMMGLKIVGQIILPFHLTTVPLAADTSFLFSLVTLPLLIILLYASSHKRSAYLWFGAAWFLVFFIPPLLFSNGTSYFDHRLYLPLIGFLIIISELSFIKNLNWREPRVIAVAALLLLILSVLTFRHSLNFRDPFAFWRAAVTGSPHSLPARAILGDIYAEQADWAAAEQEFLAALSLNPQEPIMHYNLGVVYLNRGNKMAAEIEFQRELAVNPGYYKALANLGILAYQSGQTAAAVRYWQAAVASNPDDLQSAKLLEMVK